MKWIFIGLVMIVLPTQAAQQYTESSCILLKQQVNDYKRRLGINSSLYAKTKSDFDIHCQNPITAKSSNVVSLSNEQVQSSIKAVPIKIKSVPLRKASSTQSQPVPSQSSPFTNIVKTLMTMFLLLFFGLMAFYYFKKNYLKLKVELVKSM